jgi:hypothetical protein
MLKRFAVAGIIAAGLLRLPVTAQTQFDGLQRERARQMLRDLRDAIEHHYYYDPQFHYVDLDAQFKAADARLQTVGNLGAALTTIAETIDTLKDSHTFFLPPSRNTHREYGYFQQMIGDRCFITSVRPNRDASEKLAAGDEVLAWQGYAPKRDNLSTMSYIFNTLLSLPVMNLAVRGPDGATRKVEVKWFARSKYWISTTTVTTGNWCAIKRTANARTGSDWLTFETPCSSGRCRSSL